MAADGASVGLALDGDADRIGLVDQRGRFVSTLEVFSLLAMYLLGRGDRGTLVKGVTASVMLNKLGEHYGVPVVELPVGFKNIGQRFVADHALLGGEESGGYAFRGHIPERDGILSGLYLLEYLATTGMAASEMVEILFDLVGEHHYQRRDVGFDPAARAAILGRLTGEPLTNLAGMEHHRHRRNRRPPVDAGRRLGRGPLFRHRAVATHLLRSGQRRQRNEGCLMPCRRIWACRREESGRIDGTSDTPAPPGRVTA